MKYTSSLFLLSFLLFTSCEKNSPEEIFWWHDADIVELDASNYELSIIDTSATGDFIKFSFSEGDIVTNENWDVAFRGTTLIVNGGEKANIDQPDRTGNAAVYIDIGSMSQINSVDTNRLLQDNSSGSAILKNIMIDDLGVSGQGWASYSFGTHLFSPRAGRILVFRTHNNKYAKMEIIYFYDSLNPVTSDGDIGGFYTFNYVYQSDEGLVFTKKE
jgi:hypothetical protein